MITDARFYVTGGTLPITAPCYIAREADAILHASLQRGEFCYVLNTRQMGKSSLMVRTAQRLRQEHTHVVILDLTSIGQNLTVEQWYSGLLMNLAVQLDLEDELPQFWRERRELGPMQRWIETIRQVVLPALSARNQRGAATADRAAPPQNAKLVIFVDEVDAVRGLPFSADEFFAGIRECYNRRTQAPEFEQLTFCLLGVATPADLVRDTRMSPFNIGRRILLEDFTPAEASKLKTGIESAERAAGPLLARVLHWTGGHPYLTQRLCQAIADEAAVRAPSDVDQLCERLFLSRTAREIDDNLAFVRTRLLQSEADLAALLDLYLQVRRGRRVRDDETNPLCSVLRLSGVVHSEQGRFRTRNRIYDQVFDHDWVISHLPGAELQRQRQAYWRGVVRATTIAVSAVAVVSALAGIALYQARIARQARDEAQKSAFLAKINEQKAHDSAEQAMRNAERASSKEAEAQTLARALGQTNKQLKTALLTAKRQRELADAQREVATRRGAEANAQRKSALHQKALANLRLSQMNIVAGTRLLEQGDYSGAVAPFKDAESADQATPRRLRMDRIRLALARARAPEIEHEWSVGAGRGDASASFKGMCWAEFSPDGQSVLAAGKSGSARIWDTRSGTPRTPEMFHAPGLLRATFDPSGRRLLTYGGDAQVRVWNAVTGKRIGSLTLTAPVLTACWNRDGSRIAAACMGVVSVWDSSPGPAFGTHVMSEPFRDKGGPGQFTQVLFSPDDKRLAAILSNFLAHIMDAKDPENEAQHAAIRGCYNSTHIEFSRDGRQALVAGTVAVPRFVYGTSVVDTRTGLPIMAPLNHGAPCLDARYSPDDSRIVTASADGTARVWDARTGQAITPPMRCAGMVLSARFGPDGSRIVTACIDGTAQVWDAVTGAAIGAPLHHGGSVTLATFDATGKRILTVSVDGKARLWRLEPRVAPAITVARYSELAGAWESGRYHFLRSGAVLFSCHRSNPTEPPTFIVRDLKTGRPLISERPTEDAFQDFSLSRDERRISLSDRQKVEVWDLATGRLLSSVPEVSRCILSPDGRTLLALRKDKKAARLWDVDTGRPLCPEIDSVRPLWGSQQVFSRDSRRVIIGTPHNGVQVLDARTGTPVFPAITLQSLPTHAVFTPDQRYLIICDGEGISFWNAQTGRSLPAALRLNMLFRPWDPIVISPDGARAISEHGINIATLELWNLRTLRPICRFDIARQQVKPQFSPDGSRLAVFGSGATLWDASRGRKIAELSATDTDIASIRFSSDSSRIATAGDDGIARVWDARNGRPISPPIPHRSQVVSASLSADGRLLVTVCKDGSARLWDAATGEMIARLAREEAIWDADFLPDRDAVRLILFGHTETTVQTLVSGE